MNWHILFAFYSPSLPSSPISKVINTNYMYRWVSSKSIDIIY